MKMKWYSGISIIALMIGILVIFSAPDADALFVLTLDDIATPGVDVIMADGQPAGVATLMGVTTVGDPDGLPGPPLPPNGFMSYNGAAGLNFLINVTTNIQTHNWGTSESRDAFTQSQCHKFGRRQCGCMANGH